MLWFLCRPPNYEKRSSMRNQSFSIDMPSANSPTLAPSTTLLPPLPSPSTFDILPPLHAVLSRLLLPPTNSQQTTTSTPVQSSSSSQHLPGTPAPSGYLSPKDVAVAASGVKVKIQKARAAVHHLPDVERDVTEQLVEIKELEDEVRRLTGVLRRLKDSAQSTFPTSSIKKTSPAHEDWFHWKSQ